MARTNSQKSPSSGAAETSKQKTKLEAEVVPLPEALKGKKVALVHDYLVEYGGAERVLEALHELFPKAPVYTSFVDSDRLGSVWTRFADWDIRETWITRLPFYKKLFSPYRIFSPKAFASLDLSAYDLVISSSNAYFAKAVKVPKGTHVCYCHTPARSLYGYTTGTNWQQHPVTRFFGTLINHYLRVVDFKVAQQVGYFIANSRETQQRISKFYRRESSVIHPPVHVPDHPPADAGRSIQDSPSRRFFLYVNRLALAKHPEFAVEVATQLNVPLKVVGTGPLLEHLKEIAGPTVEFLGFVPDEQLHQLYTQAKALLYPVEDEDFGIVPVEAMAHGVPVIAHNSGGPCETVIPGKTGVLFDELSAEGLRQAVKSFESSSFYPEKLYQHASQFSTQHFQQSIVKYLSKLLTS